MVPLKGKHTRSSASDAWTDEYQKQEIGGFNPHFGVVGLVNIQNESIIVSAFWKVEKRKGEKVSGSHPPLSHRPVDSIEKDVVVIATFLVNGVASETSLFDILSLGSK